MKKIFLTLLIIAFCYPAFAGADIGNKAEMAFIDNSQKQLDVCNKTFDDTLPSYDGADFLMPILHKRLDVAEKYKKCVNTVFNSLVDHFYTVPETRQYLLEQHQRGQDYVGKTFGAIYAKADFCKPSCGFKYQFNTLMNETAFTITAIREIIDYHTEFYSH